MRDLTEQDERTIRQFLQWCLTDGLYAFEIEGETYLLEIPEDVNRICKAIKQATPPVKHYRLSQARQWLANEPSEHGYAAMVAV